MNVVFWVTSKCEMEGKKKSETENLRTSEKTRQFKRKFDGFDKDRVARKIKHFLSTGELVTLRKLKASVEEENDLKMSKA